MFKLQSQILGIMKKTLVFLLLLTLILSQEAGRSVRSGERDQSEEANVGTCAKYTSDRESCLECVPHYHLFEGQCFIDIHGCSQYVFGNICRKCEHGFILVNNECCDRHCMQRIFKGYEAAAELQQLTAEQKVEKTITQGYVAATEALSVIRYQFVKFTLASTSNQILLGYIRYFIKIMANDKPYRCIADYNSDLKNVTLVDFRPQSQMSSIKEVILSQQDVIANDQARAALQFASAKFGLKTYGSSLQRVSATSYKFGTEHKLIYIGPEVVIIIHVVVPSGKKLPPYSPWSEERQDVQAIRDLVQKSMTVIKMQNKPEMEMIKQKVSETNSIKTQKVEMKSIEKIRENVFKYTYTNTQTQQVFEEISKVNPKTKQVEVVEKKQVISKDVQNMKLPESPEKKVIPKEQVTQTPEVKQVIKYLEQVQPSLANKEITTATVEKIGQNKKVTLMQVKNEQVTRVVVLSNERTHQFKLIDESPVLSSPPTETIYSKTPEGKQKITTTDVEKFRTIDKQVDNMITKVEEKLPFVKVDKIESFQKVEGTMVNNYVMVIKGDKPQQPKQQITVIQNPQTKEVRIVDVEEIRAPTFVEPVKRQPTPIPETQYKTPEMKAIIEQYKSTKPELKDTDVVIKKADVQQTKYVDQYTVVVQSTTTGETTTIKANKPHEQTKPEIVSVKPVYQKPTEQPKAEKEYVTKIVVDEVTGVKTTTTSKPEDIKQSFVTQVLQEITTTKQQPKVEQIQSSVRKEYEKTITQTVVIKEEKKYVQVVVEQNKETKQVKKISEQVIEPVIEQSKPVLPQITTTQISQTTFTQIQKVNPVLQTVTEKVVKSQPELKNEIPRTTEIEQRGPVQVVTMVYENKGTKQTKRIVSEYNQETKKTVIKEQTPLPKVIPKLTFEKDRTPEGDIKVVSNNIEQIKRQDKHFTTVVEKLTEKIPLMSEKPVRVEVISNPTNPITNTYQISVVEPTTKQLVTVSATYDIKTSKTTVSDVVEAPKPETVTPRPVEKPVVVIKPEEFTQPQFKEVVKFVQNTVETKQVTQIKQTKNTLSTCYEVTTKTPEGTKTTVSVIVSNSNPKDITLVDIVEPAKPQGTTPTPVPQAPKPSYTTTVTDSANVKDTTTNDKDFISSNKYLTVVSQEAKAQQPLLTEQQISCASISQYEETNQIVYLATVKQGNVLVSGFVWKVTGKVSLISVPVESETGSGLTQSPYSSCAERTTTITVLTRETIETMSKTDKQTGIVTSYVQNQFQVDSIEKIFVERFPESIRYVILVVIRSKTYRIVLVYAIKTSKFTVIEKPDTSLKSVKPVVLEQRVETDGTKVVSSNTVETIKTVDERVERFIEVLNKQVTIEPSSVTNIVSKQHTNTNEYTITVKDGTKTSEIKAILKKDDDTVILQSVQDKPKPLIAPLVKPKQEVPKEQYTSEKITKVIEQINSDKRVPNITTEKIVEIIKTSPTPITQTYKVVTETTTGKKQTFTVSEDVKGQVTVIDYKPAQPEQPEQPKPAQPAPSKTEYTVNPVSGIETQVTNDEKTIKQSRPINNVLSKVIEQKTVTKDTYVVSATTQTSENTVQTILVMASPQRPQENFVVSAIVDKKTDDVKIVTQKVVEVKPDDKPIKAEEQAVLVTYTRTVIANTIKDNKVLSTVINKVTQSHKELQNTLPRQVVTETFGNKVVATITFNTTTTMVVLDEKTGKVEELNYEPVPKNIKPLVYETQKSPEGNTIITTNSVEKIVQVNRNFNSVVSEIKQSIPTIQTEKIQGIRVEKPEQPDAPQKITVVFESTKKNELSQVSVVFSSNKTTIIDVQSIVKSEIVSMPEPTVPVKLSPKQVKESKVEEVLKENVQELPVKEIKRIVEVQEVKTSYTKILETRVEDTNGKTYIVKTEQFGNDKPKVIDYVQVPEQKKPEIFTITTTSPKNGIVSTYTNDVKVMTEERTYNKCVDMLENKKQLSKNGFVIDTDSISRLQRSVEHNLRYINKDTNEAFDFRATVDSRTGQITINEETKTQFSEEKPLQKVPSEKSYIEVLKPQLREAKQKYQFIDRSLDVIRKADYTFQNKEPELTQIKQYPVSQGSTGFNAVEVVMTFQMNVGGSTRKTRVVFYGEEKQLGKGYIMKIIDITPIADEIQSSQTKVVRDEYGRQTTTTSDVKTLSQNSEEYNKVIDHVHEQIPSLRSGDVISVKITQNVKANQYHLVIQKDQETFEIIANYMKDSGEVVITDFKTQSPKAQFEKVLIKQTQSIVTEVSKSQETATMIAGIKTQLTEQNIPEEFEVTNIKLQQRPQADTYVLQVVDSNNVKSTIQVLKQDDTFTVISYKPERPAEPAQPQKPVEQPKPSKTEYTVDEITGTQTLHTTDKKIISETPAIKSVINKVIQEKSIPRTSEVVQATTKTSETKIQTRIVVQQPHKPQQQTVYLAIVDRQNPEEDVEFISEETVETVEQQVETVTVITETTYKTVIKKDTHVQNIVKAVQKKYDDVKDVTPVRVTMQEVGPKTITEVTYETKTIYVVSTTETEEVESTRSEQIPENIVPGSVSTVVDDDGRKTTTATSPAILEQSQPQYKEVLKEITQKFTTEEVKSVISQDRTFVQVFTVHSQKPEQTTPTQTVYYVNKETKQVVNMGSEEMPVATTPSQPVSQPEPTKNIPETRWETKQIKSVIEEVTQVVKQEKVTKVEQLKPTPTSRLYVVTVDTPQGPESIKVVVDKQTKKPEVIEQKPEKPAEPAQPRPQQPSETKVTVDETTGVKTTTTTDKQIIRSDKTTKKVYETIVKEDPQLKPTEIVSSTKKEYDDVVEQRVVFKTDQTFTQVVTLTSKKTDTVKIIDKSTVESSQPTSSELVVTQTTYDGVVSKHSILQGAVKFLGRRYPQFKNSNPDTVNIEELPKYVKLTFVYSQNSKTFRIVVIYDRETKSYDVIEEPSEVVQTKQVLFETKKTQQGRENYFTNDVDLLTEADKNYPDMIEQVRKQINIKDDEIASIQSTKTSTGNVYVITTSTTSKTENTQVSVIFDQKTKQAKINDVQTVKAPEPQPAPRPTTTVPQSEITNDDDIELIRKKSTEEFKIPSFTLEDITKVEKSKTTVGTQYVITIKKTNGVAILTAVVTFERKVTVINYQAPRSEEPQQPTSTTEAPSKTKTTYDATSGYQIQSTNDHKLILQSEPIMHVVKKLVKLESIPKDSEVLSSVTKETTDTIKSTTTLKISETETKVVMTVTDKKTNEVKVIAEKTIPQQKSPTDQPLKKKVDIPQTIVSGAIFDEVIKKDTVLQQVIKEVKNNHPEIKQPKPERVIVQKFGSETVSEVTYQNVTITVVSNTQTGKVEEVTSSPVPKKTDKKPVTLETVVSEDGTKTIISNTVEEIVKIVPSVKPALTEVIKVVPTIKKEQIKTISTVEEEKTYTVVTVDQVGTVRQVKFKYEPDQPKPVTLFDVQEFSQASVPSKPREVVYEPVKVQQQPDVVKAVEKLNKTSTIIKNSVTQIVKIEKAVSNMAETYKVQVKTPTSEEAIIVIDVNPDNKQTVVLDVIKYEPKKQQPLPVKVEQKVDPVTQIKQTVYPDKETFKDDETYPQVIEYLKNDIKQGFDIVSVQKQNYGQNKQLTILLKSEEKSPQQIQININNFNKEITVLQNKTVVSKEAEESTLLSQDQPKPTEIKLSPADQQKFEILSKIQSIKETNDFKPMPEVKDLQKNELFNKADEELKRKYPAILGQSNIVYSTFKNTYESSDLKVYYANQDPGNSIYQAYVRMNPVTHTVEVKQFSKVGTQPIKSTLNVVSDIAFGYEPLDNFSNDKNFKFVYQQLKKNYPNTATAVIQSVEVLSLCNGRHNYRVFMKSGLEIVKYIIFYEEAFERCVFLRQKSESSVGRDFKTLDIKYIADQQYFGKANRVIKQENSIIAEESQIVQVQREDQGEFVEFRTIYEKGGRTYRAFVKLDKNNFAVIQSRLNQMLQVPVNQNEGSTQNPKQIILKVSDLARNTNFEKAYKEILSIQGSALQNAQLLGALMTSGNFNIKLGFVFMIKNRHFKTTVSVDTASKVVTVIQPLQEVDYLRGFTADNLESYDSATIEWAQKTNPDLKSGVIVESSRKKEIFGQLRKLVFKLQTKYYTLVIYKEGNDMKILSQSESTSLQSAVPAVRSFPNPNKNKSTLNNS